MKKELKAIVTISLFILPSACGFKDNVFSVKKTLSTGKIAIKVFNPSKYQDNKLNRFKINYIDSTDVFNANISITGPGIAFPITNATNPANPIRLANGKNDSGTNILANSVPSGNNRIISVQGLDKSFNSLGSTVIIKGVTNVADNVTSSVSINWQTTPTANVIEKLISFDSIYSSKVDYILIQSLVDKIINNNTLSDFADDIHPSLVNSDAVAGYINNNSGTIPNPLTSVEISLYRLTPDTISGNISGIVNKVVGVGSVPVNYIPPTKIFCNDPASEVVTLKNTSGNYTITGVTPGNNYTVKVIPDYYTEGVVTSVSSTASNVNPYVTKLHYLEHSIDPKLGVAHFKISRAINVQLIIPNLLKATKIGFISDNRKKVIEAFNMWEMFASDVLSFNILPDIYDNDPSLQKKKTDTDIYIEWLDSFENSTAGLSIYYPDVSNIVVPSQGLSFTYNPNIMPYNTGYRACITLAIRDGSSGLTIPLNSARAIAAHEIGHALGLAIKPADTLNQHPMDNPADLLYEISNYSQPTNLNIGIRDLNTLKFLYSIPPNLTRN